VVFQHGSRGDEDKKGGKKNGKIYALDFCYPFSTLQAFAFALGIHHYREKKKE